MDRPGRRADRPEGHDRAEGLDRRKGSDGGEGSDRGKGVDGADGGERAEGADTASKTSGHQWGREHQQRHEAQWIPPQPSRATSPGGDRDHTLLAPMLRLRCGLVWQRPSTFVGIGFALRSEREHGNRPRREQH